MILFDSSKLHRDFHGVEDDKFRPLIVSISLVNTNRGINSKSLFEELTEPSLWVKEKKLFLY